MTGTNICGTMTSIWVRRAGQSLAVAAVCAAMNAARIFVLTALKPAPESAASQVSNCGQRFSPSAMGPFWAPASSVGSPAKRIHAMST